MPPIPSPTAPRLFLDASVIIAGLASESGASHVILSLTEAGLFTAVVCPYVLQEVERNLVKKLPELLPLYQRMLDRLSLEQVQDPTPNEVHHWATVIIPKDAPVLAAAVNACPQRLVTLDTRDFLTDPTVVQKSGLIICTPGELLREVRALLENEIS